MTTLTATFSNPKNNYAGAGGLSAAIPICNEEFNGGDDSISTADFQIRTDVTGIYSLETNDTVNACQENSTVVVSDGTNDWFVGYVFRKKKTVTPDGVTLDVFCKGWDGILMDSIVCDANGNYTFSMETDSETLTNLPLVATSNYGSFQGSTLWPDPTDADGAKCYLDDSVANADTLAVAIGVGDYAITAVGTGAGGWFAVASNVPAEFVAGDTFTISGSTNNNKTWTVASASWTGTATRIVVTGTVGATADGTIHQPNIILSTTNQGFVPRGWVKIESEWIYFDGYDDAAGDSKYRLRNVQRGELDTVAAAHLATTAVYEKLGKQIAPGNIQLQCNPGTGYKSLRRDSEYAALMTLNAFTIPSVAAGTYRVTYSVYDEDSKWAEYSVTGVSTGVGGWFEIAENVPGDFVTGDTFKITGSTNNNGTWTVASASWTGAATRVVVTGTVGAVADGTIWAHMAVTLNDIVQTLVTGPRAYGGPGFEAADCDFDCSSIKFNRYDYDPSDASQNAKNPWDEILNVIQAVSLDKVVKFYWKHSDSLFRLVIMANGASAFTLQHVSRIDDETALDDVYSAVRVEYTDDTMLNRASALYSWHQEATGAGAAPDNWHRTTAGGTSYSWGTYTSDTSAGNFGSDMVVDGKPDTKLTAAFAHNPAASFTFGDFWFGAGTTPPKIKFDKIKIKFGPYISIDNTQPYQNDDKEYVIRFQSCTDYNSTTHVGTFSDIGFEIRGLPSDSNFAEAEASAPFRNMSGNCVRIIWDYMPGPSTGVNQYWAALHDLEIFGNTTKYMFVQLTNDVADIGDNTKLYAPETFEKLRGGVKSSTGVAGCQRTKHYPIGASSDGAALSLARTILKTSLSASNSREYAYAGLFASAPHVGLTIAVDEDGDTVADFTGVIHEYRVQRSGAGGYYGTATVINHSASVIT